MSFHSTTKYKKVRGREVFYLLLCVWGFPLKSYQIALFHGSTKKLNIFLRPSCIMKCRFWTFEHKNFHFCFRNWCFVLLLTSPFGQRIKYVDMRDQMTIKSGDRIVSHKVELFLFLQIQQLFHQQFGRNFENKMENRNWCLLEMWIVG